MQPDNMKVTCSKLTVNEEKSPEEKIVETGYVSDFFNFVSGLMSKTGLICVFNQRAVRQWRECDDGCHSVHT